MLASATQSVQKAQQPQACCLCSALRRPQVRCRSCSRPRAHTPSPSARARACTRAPLPPTGQAYCHVARVQLLHAGVGAAPACKYTAVHSSVGGARGRACTGCGRHPATPHLCSSRWRWASSRRCCLAWFISPAGRPLLFGGMVALHATLAAAHRARRARAQLARALNVLHDAQPFAMCCRRCAQVRTRSNVRDRPSRTHSLHIAPLAQHQLPSTKAGPELHQPP